MQCKTLLIPLSFLLIVIAGCGQPDPGDEVEPIIKNKKAHFTTDEKVKDINIKRI